ncbi:hypothetical protein BH11MYX1_BH11MYX1_01300 [soil metagenome]
MIALLLVGGCSSNKSDPPKVDQPSAGSAAARSGDLLGVSTFQLAEGNAASRAHFQRGLRALHAFWYDEAIREFDAAIAADPTLRMAYWGAAMSRIQVLWGHDDVTGARAILAKTPNPEGLSPREQAWIGATLALMNEGDDVPTSRKRFVAAMEDLDQAFPDDESKAFLALALLASLRPGDGDEVAVRKRAFALAMEVYKRNPLHPGAAHYAIHAYDTPTLASGALEIAKAYAASAPAAFHARHMPAHIFARLGKWPEAIASCQAAWDASVEAARHDRLSADHEDFHSLNWLIEMNFELGHRKEADRALATFAAAVTSGLSHEQRNQYALAALSYLVRTSEWKRAGELLAPLAAPAVDAAGGSGHCGSGASIPPSVNALLEQGAVIDVRALAAAMLRDVPTTKRLVGEAEVVHAKWRIAAAAFEPPQAIAQIDASYARRQRALLARASNDDVALLAILREGVAGADAREAGGESVQSGSLVREQIADILLRQGKLTEAATEYARVLASHPGRAHSLLGAARTAARDHDDVSALALYKSLMVVWATADTDTDGLAEAKAKSMLP